jgi:uncharacterized protein (TIGR03083 family)
VKVTPRYDGPAILSIEGDADEVGLAVSRQRRRMEGFLAALDADRWSSPSRCDAWSIQDVVAHLVGVNAFWEASVLAGLAGTPTRVLAGFDPAAHPPLLIEPMRALTGAEVLDQFVTSNDGLLGALASLDDDGWSTAAESPAGHVPIRLLAEHALWDAWVHERDIALPLGSTPVEEPDEIGISLRYAAAVGPALSISSPSAFTGALAVVATDPDISFVLEVGESVTLRAGSPPPGVPCLRGGAVELTEALSVRAALPAGTPDEWRELAHGLATVFDAGSERDQ